ncbi:TniQ family protein [Rhizobium sp. CB3171]|uniref:TniQ family protein n=1 Tax=Rhizobium sp. CB3171 TaxID=3039157 RepID=UPI0024B14EC6|nr:TniQ family protein [Rhizobium sp. CB3171]WFU00706.1 TniQ family protein [Rhizobium sp. CB3171]
MTDARPLPFSSWEAKPEFGEPANAYFVRLVREQDHVSARVYADDLEINGRNVRPASLLEQVLKLPLAGSYRESLRRWTPVDEPGWVILSGQRVRQSHYSHVRRRFCPACLAEGPWHRAWWDIASFTVCPFHQMPVRSRTMEGHVVKWWWPDFEHAPDGERMAVTSPRDCEKDSFEVYLLQRLGVDIGDTRLRPLLDDVDLGIVVDVCGAVGRLLSNPLSFQAPPKKSTDFRKGYDAVSRDDEHLVARLADWFEANAPASGQLNGLTQSTGWFVEGRTHVKGPAWPRLHASLQRAFVKIGHIGRMGLGDRSLAHRGTTLRELSRRTGIHVDGVRAIVAHLGIVRGEADFHWFLAESDVTRVEAFVGELVSLREAATLLGCGLPVVRELSTLGHLRTFEGTRLFGHKGGGIATRRADVERLSSLAGSATIAPTDGETSGLHKFAEKRGLSQAAVIDRVLKGEISPSTPTDPRRGLMSWRFVDPRKRGWRVRRDFDGDLSMAEAAVTVGLPRPQIAALIAYGVLKSRTHQTSVVVERQSFEEFHDRYVNARMFQEEIGCSFLGLEQALRKLGIPRELADVVAPDRLYMVDRRSLERVLGVRTEPGKRMQALWRSLYNEMSGRKTRLALPKRIGTKGAKSVLSNRWTFVRFLVEASGIAIEKTFSTKSAREWAIFAAHRKEIEEDMAVFQWSEEGDEVHCRFLISKARDVAVAADALLAYERYFPLPSGSSKSKR